MKKRNLIALSLITSLSLQAAVIPNISDALKEVKPPKLEKERNDIPSLKVDKAHIPKAEQNAKKIEVKNILISGSKYIDNKILKTIVKPFENTALSFRDMQDIAALITKEYREKGYFVARAYIPEQSILSQEGMLRINIIEGSYGIFNLENNSLVKNSIIQANLDDIKDKDIVSTTTLERVMLIINDTPGVLVNKAEVRPGQKIGTSDFIIGTNASKKYNGYILGDNYGSIYTGKHRIMVGADINSPFKIGDKITFSALSSENTGLLNASLAYSFPLYSNGLRGDISYSKTTYTLGDIYKSLDARGGSNSISFKVTYPFIRSRLENLKLYFDTSYNKMEDKILKNSSQKNSVILKIGTDYTKDFVLFNKNSQSRLNFSLLAGSLNFNNKEDEKKDKLGTNTNGNFYKINIELGQDFEINDKVRWENSLQLQYALGNKNLDGSQDLSIGGIYGVKYYPDGEGSAENGYIFNTELFYTLPKYKEVNSSISIFYDIARTYMSQDITNKKTKTLQDFGIGYYASYKDMFINTHLSYNIAHDVKSQEDYSSRFMIQAGWVF